MLCVCLFNYSLITKRVIFKMEAASLWNIFFLKEKERNKGTRFVLLSPFEQCAFSVLLQLAGRHLADRLFKSTWLVVIPNADLTHG